MVVLFGVERWLFYRFVRMYVMSDSWDLSMNPVGESVSLRVVT